MILAAQGRASRLKVLPEAVVSGMIYWPDATPAEQETGAQAPGVAGRAGVDRRVQPGKLVDQESTGWQATNVMATAGDDQEGGLPHTAPQGTPEQEAL